MQFDFADIHCHPNLKTYGHSFDNKLNKLSTLWYSKPRHFHRKLLNCTLGLTRFSQADLSTLAKGNVKIAFVSLYPFEKGFFLNNLGSKRLAAFLGNIVTGVGYNRIRHLQQHTSYFEDLEKEYHFFLDAVNTQQSGDGMPNCKVAGSWPAIEKELNNQATTFVITIEGAHVFNTGLEKYGRKTNDIEVIDNINKVKQWQYKPYFITFAHNFNNDMCGHARSLEPLGWVVDQSTNLNGNISPLGIKAIHHLLNNNEGKRIRIDVKHMSVASRKAYYNILESDYPGDPVPVICSHGAVNGLSFSGAQNGRNAFSFNRTHLNLFNDEIIVIAKTKGLFAIQLDVRILGGRNKLLSIFGNQKALITYGAQLVWNQLQHIAEVCDKAGLFAWGCTCIGSDFDGTINPPAGIPTSEQYPLLAQELLVMANHYLNKRELSLKENREITAEELLERFTIKNVLSVLKMNY